MFNWIKGLIGLSQSNQVSVMTKFQVANLISQRVSFEAHLIEKIELELSQRLASDEEASRLLKMSAQSLDIDALINKLKSEPEGLRERPILLICRSGKISLKLAAKIASMGYKNLYVLDGGIIGLLDSSSSE